MDKSKSLPEDVLAIVKNKGTERPYSGDYDDFSEMGTFLCRQCGLGLFHSSAKFHSGCGWPSFDHELPGSIKRQVDADGMRSEILCARCDAHLGHVFEGEGFTQNNTRHCVNSLSLDFVTATDVTDSEEAIFAAGCFWGVEHYFKQLPGVLKTQVGYSGGDSDSPTYEQVCRGDSGHYEVIRVVYDPSKIDFQHVCQYFFEIHNFSQDDGQGPDIGHQYLSVIFHFDEKQRKIAEMLISELKKKNYSVSTKIMPVCTFWPAEQYHQNYYEKMGKSPYCHTYTKIFPK